VKADDVTGYSTIQQDLPTAGERDSGAGSTLAALRRRGLIDVGEDVVSVPGLGLVPVSRVKLTTAGRAAARAGRGQTAPQRTPKGLMAGWLWESLARLYAAGDTGLPLHAPAGTPRPERTPSWNALLHLRDRSDGAYMEEVSPGPGGGEWRVRVTSRGRTHYERHHRCYP
jgi:hypothetical protein